MVPKAVGATGGSGGRSRFLGRSPRGVATPTVYSLSLFLFLSLKYIGDDFVGDFGAVLLPVLSVFVEAALVVPEGSVEEEDSEEDDVKIGEKIVEESRNGPEEGSGDFGNVVKMARKSPPA